VVPLDRQQLALLRIDARTSHATLAKKLCEQRDTAERGRPLLKNASIDNLADTLLFPVPWN
jgi:hypothetical protein